VKLRLLSKSAAQSTYRRLSKDETIPPTGRRPVAALHQDVPGVALAQVTLIQFRVGEIQVEF